MQNDTTNNNQSGVTPFVSFETAWASLAPELNKEAAKRAKKKRRYLFFLLSFLIIGLGGASLYLYNNHKNISSSVAKNGMPPIKSIETTTQSLPVHVAESVKQNPSKQTTISNATAFAKHKNPQQTSGNTYPQKMSTKGIQVKTKTLLNTDKKSIFLPKAASLESEFVSKLEKANNNDSASLIAKKHAITIQDSIKNGVLNDSTNLLIDSTLIQNCITQTLNKSIKKRTKGISFGIQLNAPIQANAYSINTKSDEDPLIYLIPTFFITKQITAKAGFIATLNPYAQYYTHDKLILYSNEYLIQFQRGSTQNEDPLKYSATQSLIINKLMGIEASLLYQYGITNKVQIGIGLGNLWVQNAFFQCIISQSDVGVTQDSIYTIGRKSHDWNWINHHMLSGKLEASYKTKNFSIGLSANVPLGYIANTAIVNQKTVSKNLFVRWYIR